MTRTISDEEKAILARGGLTLADLLDYHCRLPEWADSGVFGDEFCAKCEHKPDACHMGAIETRYLVYHFCAFIEGREWDMAHPQVIEVGA